MHNHQLYVPDKFVEAAEEVAVQLAGGCTSFPGARGLWRAPDGQVLADPITVVQVFEDGTKALEAIVGILFSGGEQAVAYVTDGIPALRYSIENLEIA